MQGVCVVHNGFSKNYFVSVLGIFLGQQKHELTPLHRSLLDQVH